MRFEKLRILHEKWDLTSLTAHSENENCLFREVLYHKRMNREFSGSLPW